MRGVGLIATMGVVFALGVASSAGAQQQHSTEWRTKPAKERYRGAASRDAAMELAAYSRCVANLRYDKARSLVLSPYASSQQAAAARQVIQRGNDDCMTDSSFGEARLGFAPEILAGGVAQVLVLKDYPDLPAMIGSYQWDAKAEAARSAQLNAAEIFGRCVVHRDSAAALALFSSQPASQNERVAIDRLRDDLGQCLAPGSTIKINGMFLRNAAGVAAYRLGQQIQPRCRKASASR